MIYSGLFIQLALSVGSIRKAQEDAESRFFLTKRQRKVRTSFAWDGRRVLRLGHNTRMIDEPFLSSPLAQSTSL